MRLKIASAALAMVLAAGTQANAETLKFAFQGTYNQLDPYSLNETFSLSMHGNVYETLVRRSADLKIEPALATSWEVIEPTRWRFHLRKGVKFHNGNDFNADDVIFSADRVRAEGSDLTQVLSAEVKVEKVDDYTVDFILPGVNPILHSEWENWPIMDKEWTEANDAVKVTSASDTNPNYASLHANGTGPFKIASHEPGVKTTYTVNDSWWDEKQHNLTGAEFTPIGSDATRVAALLSGELDMAYPIPVQDIKRVDNNAGTSALTGPELRTIFLGFDQRRDELTYSNIKGKNPFKDVRVRKAFYQAIDVDAIKAKIMRGLSEPSALLISPFLFANSGDFSRYPYDPEAAKALLAEAGYADGFEVSMDCPNDRYVNDEAICQATAAFLARVGIKINLNAQPKAKYFAKVLASGGFDTSFYMLGWTPGSFDSYNILKNLNNCRDDKGTASPFNLGGYCNPKVDELTKLVLSENDEEKRNALISEAYTIINNDVSHIPLHQQGLAWGVSDKVTVTQRADNKFLLKYVNFK
ncbi:ABC transporter substrate-binding protein [Pseudovibrio japonicus]|uniref:ABC transporter substrate-binding protein n=1 Tax=Pseudovibrio japonicus TaxID=366534 RepID=A0ABQ3EPB1_9HYPH|nr:ABC transporter substrate-binding protein [Pseudovibrio japonicus]GHB38240.1 ABC transporter substrate-binding protein [Pseudovibrio japonicus]